MGFILFAAFFVLLGVTAWVSKSALFTNSTPAIISALLGLVTNPSAATDPSKPAPPATGNWAQWQWKVLIIAGVLSTFACAGAMVAGGHGAAQDAFEVVGGGLFGLLIDTSQLSPYQALIKAIQSGFNKPQQ